MHAYQMNWQRLPLEGTANTRELGGYPVWEQPTGGQGAGAAQRDFSRQDTASQAQSDKDFRRNMAAIAAAAVPASHGRCLGQTAWHRFLRSDTLWQVSDSDIEFLRGYGVRLVLDLRGKSEAQRYPDRSLGPDVTYLNIPLADFNAADAKDAKRLMAQEQITPGEVYAQILDNRAAVAAIMRAILDVPEGACVLFHCQAGKDRTGVLAMLLMSLAGVDRQDCIANYAQTRTNLLRTKLYQRMLDEAGPLRNMIDSLPQTMAYTYDYVQRQFGGAAAYLRGCGLSNAELSQLRDRLLA